jgi:hypothetical protein
MEIKLITEKERLTWVKMSREGGKIFFKRKPYISSPFGWGLDGGS